MEFLKKDSCIFFKNYTITKKIVLVSIFVFIQSVTCFGYTVCSDCCLIPGNYDGNNGVWYYKDMGGLRQYQIYWEAYGASGGYYPTEEKAKSEYNKWLPIVIANTLATGDTTPCLNLPPSLSEGYGAPVEGTKTVFGRIVSCQTNKYCFEIRGYYFSLKEIQCIDDSIDTDEDGIPDCSDNCPWLPNPGQADIDGDGIGNVCDEYELDSKDTQDKDLGVDTNINCNQ